MIVPESRSRDAGKCEQKVKPEMWVCDYSLERRGIISSPGGDWMAAAHRASARFIHPGLN